MSLSCGVATSAAAQGGLVINEQIQLGDVFSSQTLHVYEAPEGVSVTSTSVGNIVSAVGQQRRVDFQSDQQVDGRVQAASDLTVAGATGEFFVTDTSATGNSGTAGTCCATTYGSSLQTVSQGALVAADAVSKAGGVADSISVDATAVGNTQGWNQVNGTVDTWTDQRNAGVTSATNNGVFAGSTGNIGLAATSIGNNVTVDAENSAVDVAMKQDREGALSSVVNATVGYGADVQAMATASGNLVDASASGQEVMMSVTQTASGALDAHANLTLSGWSGDATAIGYGVGNSVVMSNVGPASTLHTDQTSSGNVSGTATFTGGTGSAVLASSTAIGNAVSGYNCTECGGDFGGFNRQVNGGGVRSQSNVRINGRSGLVSAQSSAIGNSATYEIRSSGR